MPKKIIISTEDLNLDNNQDLKTLDLPSIKVKKKAKDEPFYQLKLRRKPIIVKYDNKDLKLNNLSINESKFSNQKIRFDNKKFDVKDRIET